MPSASRYETISRPAATPRSGARREPTIWNQKIEQDMAAERMRHARGDLQPFLRGFDPQKDEQADRQG